LVLFLVLSANIVKASSITVNDILVSIEESNSKIADKTMVIISTIQIPSGQGIFRTSKYTLKKPDKIKIETISPTNQTIILNGKIMTIKLTSGRIITREIETSSDGMFFIKLGCTCCQPGLFSQYDAGINEKETDEENQVYAIDFSTQATNSKVSRYTALTMYVDYKKKVIKSINFYNDKGELTLSVRNEKFIFVDGIWLETVSKTIIYSPSERIQIDTSYKNIKINRGISDDEFLLQK